MHHHCFQLLPLLTSYSAVIVRKGYFSLFLNISYLLWLYLTTITFTYGNKQKFIHCPYNIAQNIMPSVLKVFHCPAVQSTDFAQGVFTIHCKTLYIRPEYSFNSLHLVQWPPPPSSQLSPSICSRVLSLSKQSRQPSQIGPALCLLSFVSWFMVERIGGV